VSDLSCSDEKPIKILHLIDSGGLYGAEKMLLSLCKEQIKKGLDVAILSCGKPGEALKVIETEAEKSSIPLIAWRMAPGFNFEGMKDIWLRIEQGGFTVLHSHGYKFNVLLALTRKGHPPRIVSTVHGYTESKFLSKGWAYQIIDRLLLSRLDSITFVNTSQALPWYLWLLYRRKIGFIANGIDLSTPCPERIHAKSLRKFLIVGRLSPEKGHIYAFEALKLLLRKSTDCSLTVAGEGPLKAELLSAVKREGLQANVEFLGFVKDMGGLYRKHDAVLMPSLTEGLPITLLESIRCEIPVFATAVGAIPTLLTTPFLVEKKGSGESLYEALLKWEMLDTNLQQQAIATVSKRLREQCSLERMTECYLKVYKRKAA